MKKAFWALVAVIAGVVLVMGVVRLTDQGEPVYEGRTLSSWLVEWKDADYNRTNAAANAIRGNFGRRVSAMTALEDAQSDFDIVVRALIQAAKVGGTNETDTLARRIAINTLVKLRKRPDLVVPMLTVFLTNSDPGTRCWAMGSLGHLGTEASNSVPLLRQAASDSNPDVRESAKNAFDEIVPNGARK